MNINTLQYYDPKSQLDNVLLTYTKHRLFKDNHAWLVTKVDIKELIKRNKKQTAVINIRKYHRISGKKKKTLTSRYPNH